MKKIFVLLYLAAVAVSLHAVPADPHLRKVLTLADGSKVEARLCGDEFGHYWQTADGSCYLLDNKTDRYQLVSGQAIAERAALTRMTANEARAKRLTPRKYIGGSTGGYSYQGKKKGLLILAQFSDVAFKKSHNKAFYENVLNGVNFTDSKNGFKGSVSDYFRAVSNGQFELDFDIVGPVTVSNTQAYYGGDTDSDHKDVHVGEFIAEACQLAADSVNFADYDWDDDGEVDQVYVLYAGYGQASSGKENTIWPHEWNLESANGKVLSIGGKTIDTYACGNELTYISKVIGGKPIPVSSVDGIGTICHEFSHCLGLPDLYDTGYTGNFGMGDWDLMSSGSYNGNSFQPPYYTAYEKWYCGWQTPVTLSGEVKVSDMKSSADYGQTYVIYNPYSDNEYYLLENRQPTNWDESLPGKGLLITHVDYNATMWQYNLVNTTSTKYNNHQRMTIFHADKSVDLQDADQSGDTYPYTSSDGTFSNNSLTDTSSPADSIYNGGISNAKLMGISLTNITQNSDGTIAFDFKGGAASGISEVGIAPQADDKVYNLSGVVVGEGDSALPKGIYIRGGKKYVKH